MRNGDLQMATSASEADIDGVLRILKEAVYLLMA